MAMSVNRDERPPTRFTVSRQRDTEAIPRWVPPSVLKKEAAGVSNERHDQIFRRVRGILNKLTPEKFDKLSLELLNVGIENPVVLKGVILLIFDKALEEPKYSKLYAQLCHRLCEDAPNFEPPSSGISSFRRLLLNKCQDEFENRSRATEVYDKKDGPLTEEENEQYRVAKEKMLGNIKFIGELGKLEMLHEGILHKCIQQLLEKKKNTALSDMEEDLECLCQIMRTVGPRLDSHKARAWIDQYFSRIRLYANSEELPSRIRFMLQDVIELRSNEWKPRRVAAENGPKTIGAIRQEATNGRHAKVFPSQINGMGHQWKGFGDIFSMPVGSMSNAIGTGPGVIQVDNYGGPNQQYTGNRGGGGRGGGGGGGGMGRDRGNQQNQGGFHQNNNFRNHNQDNNGSPQNQRRNNQNPQHGQQGQQPLNRQGGGAAGSRDNIPPRFQRMQNQGGPGSFGPSGPPGQPMPMGSSSDAHWGGATASSPPITGGLLNGKGELSLRPQKNFMFKPNTPDMLPRSAQASPSAPMVPQPGTLALSPKKMVDVANPLLLNPILAKQPQITIKPAKEEKPKPKPKETISKDELREKVPDLLNDFFTKQDMAEIVNAVKELKIPKRMVPDFLAHIMIGSVTRTESEQDEVMKLISALKADKVVSCEQFMESFKLVADQISALEQDTPLIKSHAARFGAQALAVEVVSLQELAHPFQHGHHYPLFMLCLQAAHRIKDKQWLVNIFNHSKINLQSMLPEIDQKKERMMEILEDRGLSFMFPLMRVQSELGRQIAAEPTAGAIFKWIKERVDPQLFTDPKFISILITSVVKYITGESTLAEGVAANYPEKTHIDKEKELVEKLKGVIQKFLHEHIDLQMAALYAVQVFCFNNNFPKGMLLRFFMLMYDEEIVEEEAFLHWKEEISDQYPGKGKALFQVNQWLTWLEQAEEESEEEDGE